MTNFYFNDIKLLDIELSNNCNAACPMCARNIHGYSTNPRLQLNELTFSDIPSATFVLYAFVNLSFG